MYGCHASRRTEENPVDFRARLRIVIVALGMLEVNKVVSIVLPSL
jgi:hypothetical protein